MRTALSHNHNLTISGQLRSVRSGSSLIWLFVPLRLRRALKRAQIALSSSTTPLIFSGFLQRKTSAFICDASPLALAIRGREASERRHKLSNFSGARAAVSLGLGPKSESNFSRHLSSKVRSASLSFLCRLGVPMQCGEHIFLRHFSGPRAGVPLTG